MRSWRKLVLGNILVGCSILFSYTALANTLFFIPEGYHGGAPKLLFEPPPVGATKTQEVANRLFAYSAGKHKMSYKQYTQLAVTYSFRC